MGNSSSEEEQPQEEDEAGWIGKNPTKYKYVEVKKSSLELEKEHKARIQRLSKCSRTAATFCRSNLIRNLKLLNEHADIGCNQRKWHAMVTDGVINKERKGKFQLIMRMITVPTTASSAAPVFDLQSAKQVQRVTRLLTSISHSSILSILNVGVAPLNNAAFIFTWFTPQGSLRDLIREASPLDPAAQKYGDCIGTVLKPSQICQFGAQILDGLIYFQKMGFPYYHLHAGNVAIIGENAYLTDFEASFFLLQHPYRSKLAKLKVHPSLGTFGALLYEMCTGRTTLNVIRGRVDLSDVLPMEDDPNFTVVVTELLSEIFSDPSLTLEELRNHSIFRGVPPRGDELEHDHFAFALRPSSAKLLNAMRQYYTQLYPRANGSSATRSRRSSLVASNPTSASTEPNNNDQTLDALPEEQIDSAQPANNNNDNGSGSIKTKKKKKKKDKQKNRTNAPQNRDPAADVKSVLGDLGVAFSDDEANPVAEEEEQEDDEAYWNRLANKHKGKDLSSSFAKKDSEKSDDDIF